ncbi:MAG: DUF1801 domain-containing protein [Bernardetiaceae bacterium]|jgi:hypothetical protein|nr:DUF1801 domain-containing protein [Bernardetiaceae bacterium]
MATPCDEYLPKISEELREPLLELEGLILSISPLVEQRKSWGTPFFYLDGKMYCFLTVIKGENVLTLGICNGRFLVENQALLTGIGKAVRHLKVPPGPVDPAPVLAVLRESAALLATFYQMRNLP